MCLQVWYPDSALKTAQAMEEFDLEGLPLIIFANWRGFSGGQRDLFEGVLQTGSLIVDQLRQYQHPAFVYLPPGCELRGGAWVVIDSKINPSKLEMYADPTASGGVLEPEGVVEIKFKKSELIKMMYRLDPELQRLAHMGDESAVNRRVSHLLPAYHRVALQFAEMHDTPMRMQAKGVIRGIVPWDQSRSFFIARLKRRLAEDHILKDMTQSNPAVTRATLLARLKSQFLTENLEHDAVQWDDDRVVHDWLMAQSQSQPDSGAQMPDAIPPAGPSQMIPSESEVAALLNTLEAHLSRDSPLYNRLDEMLHRCK